MVQFGLIASTADHVSTVLYIFAVNVYLLNQTSLQEMFYLHIDC